MCLANLPSIHPDHLFVVRFRLLLFVLSTTPLFVLSSYASPQSRSSLGASRNTNSLSRTSCTSFQTVHQSSPFVRFRYSSLLVPFARTTTQMKRKMKMMFFVVLPAIKQSVQLFPPPPTRSKTTTVSTSSLSSPCLNPSSSFPMKSRRSSLQRRHQLLLLPPSPSHH